MREEATSQRRWSRPRRSILRRAGKGKGEKIAKGNGKRQGTKKARHHPRVIRSLMVELYSLWPPGQANGESLKKKGMKIPSVIMMIKSRMSLPANAR